ncbi:MAG: LapA family protein [Gammaproteobacteria bacterium]|nr:LapA family protein [Gammaproteobacteria bacterium]
MIRIVLLSVILVVFLLGLVFHLQNDHLVVFNYFLGSIEYYFSVFMVLGFISGALLGVCAMMTVVLRLQNRVRKLNKQISLRDKEVTNLRSIPYRETG